MGGPQEGQYLVLCLVRTVWSDTHQLWEISVLGYSTTAIVCGKHCHSACTYQNKHKNLEGKCVICVFTIVFCLVWSNWTMVLFSFRAVYLKTSICTKHCRFKLGEVPHKPVHLESIWAQQKTYCIYDITHGNTKPCVTDKFAKGQRATISMTDLTRLAY